MGARWDPSWGANGGLLQSSLAYGRKEGLWLALSRQDGGGRWPEPGREQEGTPWLRLEGGNRGGGMKRNIIAFVANASASIICSRAVRRGDSY